MTAPAHRVAIVTGAASGIGLGIAEALLASGSRVVLVGRRSAELRAAAEHLDPGGTRTEAVAADVGSAEECHRVVEAAVTRFGGIDVLCLNAGVYPSAKLAEITQEHLEQIFATNVYGVVHMVQAAHGHLAAAGAGRIVLTSSITGPITGMVGYSVYGASKAAQLGLMRGLALELAPDGITINSVLPGKITVETTPTQNAEYIEAALRTIPIGRLGEPADIASAVTFLTSPAAAFITGQTLVIDGGQVLPEVIAR